MFGLNKKMDWMGTRDSYEQAVQIEKLAMSFDKMGMSLRADGSRMGAAEEVLPRLYTRQGNVGVISIRGPLLNSENAFMEIMGISTYPAIQSAAVFAAMDDKVDRVMLDINSGGGMVSGVESTVDALRELRDRKPVATFTDGMMASAAYWIGSVGSPISSTKTALLGSIGVLMVHMDYSEALKKEGVNATVIRAGKYKALGHPAEPYTDAAQEQDQARVDAIYALFVEDVAANLGMSVEQTLKVADGKEFLGAEAVKVGLSDKLATAEQALAEFAQQNVDKKKQVNHNPSQTSKGLKMSRPTIVGAELSANKPAAAAPVSVSTNEASVDAAAAALTAVAAVTETTLTAEVSTTEAAGAPAAAEPAAEPVENKEVAELRVQVAMLEKQLEKAQADMVSAIVEFKTREKNDAESMAALPKLLEIAAASVNQMSIALGQSEANLSTLSAKDLVERHNAVASDFTKRFPTGRVSATSVESEPSPSQNTVVPIQKARAKATLKIGSK